MAAQPKITKSANAKSTAVAKSATTNSKSANAKPTTAVAKPTATITKPTPKSTDAESTNAKTGRVRTADVLAIRQGEFKLETENDDIK